MNTPTPQALSEAQMAEAVGYAEVFIELSNFGKQTGWKAPSEELDMARALLQSRAEVERLRTALNPHMWDARISAAWHVAIPDLQVAFDAIRSIAAQDKEKGNGNG